MLGCTLCNVPRAVQIFVKRGHVWSQLGAGGRRPHEEAQQLFECLASDLFSARYLKQLLLKFGQLVRDKRDGFKVEIILPAAPSDAVPELSFAPANWRVKACQEADQKARLLHESLLGEHGEQVVYIEPGLVRVPGEQGVGAKFGSKVTDCVMKKLACVLKKQAPLLVWPHLHAFVRGFEVQGQSDRLAVSIIVQERACNIFPYG